MEPDFSTLYTEDITSLDEAGKVRYLLAKISKERQPKVEEFERLVAQLELEMLKKQELDEEKKLDILKQAKVVAMTVTGAAIQRNLLKKLSPKVGPTTLECRKISTCGSSNL